MFLAILMTFPSSQMTYRMIQSFHNIHLLSQDKKQICVKVFDEKQFCHLKQSFQSQSGIFSPLLSLFNQQIYVSLHCRASIQGSYSSLEVQMQKLRKIKSTGAYVTVYCIGKQRNLMKMKYSLLQNVIPIAYNTVSSAHPFRMIMLI